MIWANTALNDEVRYSIQVCQSSPIEQKFVLGNMKTCVEKNMESSLT